MKIAGNDHTTRRQTSPLQDGIGRYFADKAIPFRTSPQKSGAARAEERCRGVPDEPPRHQPASGVSIDRATAQQPVLPQLQGSRTELRQRMREIATTRVRYGYRRGAVQSN